MMRMLAILTTMCMTLAACGGDSGETTTSTAMSTSTTATGTPVPSTGTSTTSTTTTTTLQASTRARSSEPFPGRGDTALLTSVEVAQRDDLARITFSFEGDVVPAHRVEYVEPPITEAGSGQELDIGGTAFLQVTTSPGAGVDLSGNDARETFSGEDRFTPDQANTIVEVAETGDFESVLTWVIGVGERLPFVVDADPGTLTVEVLDESTSDSEPDALGATPAECTSPEGYSISYPSEWWANDGSVADACGLFGPEPIDLEPATDVTAPINVFVDPVAFEVAAAPTETGEEVDRAVTLIDGTRAVRVVSRASEGLLPEGTRVTSYIVDASAGDEDRTLIATTADLDAYDYAQNVRVLDAMARTLDLDMATPSDLVARYEGGGAPFDVIANGADGMCLTVSPRERETCFETPDDDGVRAATENGVLFGLAGADVFEVETVDGASFLTVPIQGAATFGWAIPADTPNEITARDRDGNVLSTVAVGGG